MDYSAAKAVSLPIIIKKAVSRLSRDAAFVFDVAYPFCELKSLLYLELVN